MADAIDNRILDVLVEDGRASFALVGEQVGLSAHAVGERVRRLVATGAIRGFTATIDEHQLGRELEAVVDVRVASAVDANTFERFLDSLASVRRWAFLTGRFDYSVWLSCRSSEELDHTVRTIRTQGAAATETHIVMRSRTVAPRPIDSAA